MPYYATTPTLTGFQTFIVDMMGIDTTNLPPQSPVIQIAFDSAMDVVNLAIAQSSINLYNVAVYNLAGDFLINWAQDVPNNEFFERLRKKWKLDNFASGVVSSTTDASTATTLEVIEAAKNFTISDLANLRTPYGRVYLGIAQNYGPSVWGLS